MAFFDDIINKLFQGKGKALHQETLQRKKKEIQNFEEWKQSEQFQVLLQGLKKSYYFKKTNITGDHIIQLLESPYANGFAVMYDEELMTPSTFQHLMDYWKEKIMVEGYKLANSDKKMKSKGQAIETVEKHYLKPALSSIKPPIDQKYGNILIAFHQLNDQPQYLKLTASIYSDHLYQEARPFSDLLDILFEEAD